jgi:hypothetical protein
MISGIQPSTQYFSRNSLEYRQSTRSASPSSDRESIGNDTPPSLQGINGGGQFNRRTWEESKALYTLGLIPAHALLLDYLCLKLWRVGFSTTKLAIVLAEEIGLTRSTLYRAISVLKKKLPGLFRFSRPLYKGKELTGDNRIRITRTGTLPTLPATLEPEEEEFGEWDEGELTGMTEPDPRSDRATVFLAGERARPTNDNDSNPNPRRALESPKNVDLLLDNFKDLSFFSRTDELGSEREAVVDREEGRKEFFNSSFYGCDGESPECLTRESVSGLIGGESVSLSVSGLTSSESVSPVVGVKLQRRGLEVIEGGRRPLERVRRAVEWVKGKGFGNTGSVIDRPPAPSDSDSYATGGVSSVRDNPMPQTLEAQTSPRISDPREEEIKTLPPSFLRNPIVARLSDSDRRSLWEYAVARCKELPNWSRDDRYPRIKSPTAWILSTLEKGLYQDWLAVTSTVTVESIVRSSSPAAPATPNEGIVKPSKPVIFIQQIVNLEQLTWRLGMFPDKIDIPDMPEEFEGLNGLEIFGRLKENLELLRLFKGLNVPEDYVFTESFVLPNP